MRTTVSSAEVGVGAGEHEVLLYDCDSDLAQAVSGYLAGALRAGGGAIVIATEAHHRAFAAQLASVGLDPSAAGEQGVAWLDAAEVLATFMPAGRIDAEAFHREVGSAITKAAGGGRPVCVYGEMVQLLWDAGQVVAALELESLWNEVIGEHRCSLMCAYRSSSVSGAEHAEALQRVCELHSSVLHAPAGQLMQTSVDDWSLGPQVVAQLLPEPKAPRDARRFVADTLRRKGHDAALVDDAQAVASELATNAVIHARSAFSVAVRSSHRGVRLSVRDASPRRPVIPDRVSGIAGGRGLRLVAALATEWGVEATTAGKTVWAELEARATRPRTGATTTFPERPSPATAGARARSGPRTGRGESQGRAALYRHLADTLERSAELAERHAWREQDNHPERSAELELERARRARKAAQRARDLASGTQEQHAPRDAP